MPCSVLVTFLYDNILKYIGTFYVYLIHCNYTTNFAFHYATEGYWHSNNKNKYVCSSIISIYPKESH